MEDELRVRLTTLQVSPEEIAARTGAIHAGMLRESPNLWRGDFHSIGSVDLERLFDCYDRSVGGREATDRAGPHPGAGDGLSASHLVRRELRVVAARH